MPIPSAVKQARIESRRLELVTRLANLAAEEVMSIAQEVLGEDKYIRQLAAAVFRNYCSHLIDHNISIAPGKYEPHAMYMRAFMLDALGYAKKLRDLRVGPSA